jgi:hypothetical protein
MKATASSATGKIPPENTAAVSLPVRVWEEETFGLPLGEMPASHRRRALLDWEEVEAVGAADDPARFQIDVQTADALVLRVEHSS